MQESSQLSSLKFGMRISSGATMCDAWGVMLQKPGQSLMNKKFMVTIFVATENGSTLLYSC
jgi:hypothetical protein